MQADKVAKVRKGEELDAVKLEIYLNVALPEVGNILEINQFPGGFSNLTYLIRTEHAELVLRRPPFGANIKSGHDMSREFRVLSALQKSGFTKIPTPLSMEADGHLLDVPFYLMQRLNGVILRAKDGQNRNLTPEILLGLFSKQ